MELEYLQENGKKFLVFKKRENQEIDYVTLGMMENNEIIGTLSFMYRQIDNEVEFRYDCTELKPVKELFENKANRANIIRFFKAFAEMCITCEKYMIDFAQIFLDPEYIFATDDWTNIKFVLIPLENADVKIKNQLRDIVLGLDFDRTENCSYVAELLSYFQHNAVFSLEEFSDMIYTIENDDGRKIQSAGGQFGAGFQPEQAPQSGTGFQSGQAPQSGTGFQPGQVPQSGTRFQPGQAPQSGTGFQPGQVPQSGTGFQPGQAPQSGTGFQPGQISQFGTGFQPGQAPQSGTGFQHSSKLPSEIKENTEHETNKKGIFGLGKKTDKKEKNAKSVKNQGFGNIAIPGVEDGGYSTGSVQIPKGNQTIKAQEVPMQSYYTEQKDFGETTILGGAQGTANPMTNTPKIFELVRTSTGERYQITKPITKIGRKEALVDICITGNAYIGRIHAMFYLKEGALFVEDNGSVNGTFVNGKQDKITDMVKLQSGDKVILGDEELMVC